MPKSNLVNLSLVILFTVFKLSENGVAQEVNRQDMNRYTNPVVPYSLPDPSVIRADDG